MVKVALIGYGYWGPHLLRNLSQNVQCKVEFVVDRRESRLKAVRQTHPTISVFRELNETILESVDAVFIATPAESHYDLASQAIIRGSHVWLEKPASSQLDQVIKLKELAERYDKVCVVDHTYVYSEPVQWIKEQIKKKKLGDITYIHSVRANLGIFQPDVSVLWDLAIHDVSIIQEVLEDVNFESVSCIQFNPLKGPTNSVSNMTITASGIPIFIHNNWLSPIKTRLLTIGGTSGSITFDDTEQFDKIKLSTSEIKVARSDDESKSAIVNYKLGTSIFPRLNTNEALHNGINAFFDSITKGSPNQNSIKNSLVLYKILTAAESSHKKSGETIKL